MIDKLIAGIFIGGLICIISFIGFMISTIMYLDEIKKEQEKITQYIPFDYLEKKSKTHKKRQNKRVHI